MTGAGRKTVEDLDLCVNCPGASARLGEVWDYRQLLLFLAWRDVKIRYRQTALGVLWVLLQPLLALAIFTVLFGHVFRVPSSGLPYPAFAAAGLLPWLYFSSALSRASLGLVSNASLVSKVYFPRLVVPLASVVSPLVDLGVGVLLLGGLCLWYSVIPGPSLAILPLILLLAVGCAAGFGIWFSALNARWRDVGQALPFFVQLWLYVTPVLYGLEALPPRWQGLVMLNPMVAITEGTRWALFGGHPATFLRALGPALAVTALALASGIAFHRSTERTLADVI